MSHPLGRLAAGNTPQAMLASQLRAEEPAGRPLRVAVLSLLFNWPSSGGGIYHTVELVEFLGRAGYEVKHIIARNLPWGIGRVDDPLPYAPQVLEFDAPGWNIPTIQARFRAAVCEFDPDCVIVTDSWNSKPLLALAVEDYPYLLRLQASECLCPLNNLRLLPGGRQCPNHQLAGPDACARCVGQWEGYSGALHRAERDLCGVGTAHYDQQLRRALRGAAAVLVVEPLAAAMLSPYCRKTCVIPSGFDADRFPWPWQQEPPPLSDRATVLMAGLVEDPMKGFSVLHEACRRLWRDRQDFALVATGSPAGQVDGCTRFIGWRSQEELPTCLRAADVVVLPPLGAEALGRTAVEAMAVGRPVLASRIGGLPTTLSDAAGLLFEPGDATDLARQLAFLLDHPQLRQQLGLAGRRRFERHFTWDAVIGKHYRPLLQQCAGVPFTGRNRDVRHA